MDKHRVDADDLQVLLVLSRGERKRQSLPTLLDWSIRKVDRRLLKLQRYNWVKSSSFGHYALTASGVRQLEQRQSPEVKSALHHTALKQMVDLLPSEAHQAFFRLLLCGVVSKYHLLDRVDGPWPAFLMSGKTKAFKTALAHVVCHALGLDAQEHIYSLHTAVAGEFGVRRIRQKGKKSFKVEPSPYFDSPFLCLDELDKVTDREVSRNVLFFLHGQRSFSVEGKVIVNHVCPLAILNPKTKDQLPIPEPYLRRSVVLNTDSFLDELKDVDLQARDIFAWMDQQAPGIVLLERLKIKDTKLSERKFQRMRQLFLDHVDPDYHSLVDSKPLELLVLGRTALIDQQMDEAIFQTVFDRLICLETQGKTVPNWRQRVVDLWIKWGGKVDPELQHASEQTKEKKAHRQKVLEQREDKLQQESIEQTHSQLNLIRIRGEALAELKEADESLKAMTGKVWKAKAQPLREQLKLLVQKAKKATTENQVHGLADLRQQVMNNALTMERDYKRDQEKLQYQQQQEKQLVEASKALHRQIKEVEYFLRRKIIKPGEEIVEILAKLDCVTGEFREFIGYSLPKELEVYEPELVKEGLMNSRLAQTWAGLIAFGFMEYQRAKIPGRSLEIDKTLMSTWVYGVLIALDDNEYPVHYFDSWPKAWSLLQKRLDQLQPEKESLPSDL